MWSKEDIRLKELLSYNVLLIEVAVGLLHRAAARRRGKSDGRSLRK